LKKKKFHKTEKQEDYITILYDKEDALKFKKYKNIFQNKVYVFSPNIEIFLKNIENLKIFKPSIYESKELHLRTLSTSKKIISELNTALNTKEISRIDPGIVENIYNIFSVITFSMSYLYESLSAYERFTLYKEGDWKNYENKDLFFKDFFQQILCKNNQKFLKDFNVQKVSGFCRLLKIINKYLFKNIKKRNRFIFVSGSKNLINSLQEIKYNNIKYIIFKKFNEFNIFHLFYNLGTYLKFFKQINFFYSLDNSSVEKNFLPILNKIFKNINNPIFKNFKFSFKKIILNYVNNQYSLLSDINNNFQSEILSKVIVDQLRFGEATLLSSFAKKNNVDVILIPHGSISTPKDANSKFALSICSRGLIFSNLARYVVAQSKVLYEAIKLNDPDALILKSKPIGFGNNLKKINMTKKKEFIFLHASTPKSLCVWPWIYETYYEYCENIKIIIRILSGIKNVKLVIRFRSGPECDLNSFKKIINIKKYPFVKISNTVNFTDDICNCDALISFSSTSIEESLYLLKPVLLFNAVNNYRHINYKFKNTKQKIFFSTENNLKMNLDIILNKFSNKNDHKKTKSEILFSDIETKKKNSLEHYLLKI
jgi:hypothetical protein